MNKWNIISGLIPLLILAIIFALPIKTVPVQTTESYWDIEMRSEPYTESEAYTETEPYITTETYQRSIASPYYYSDPYNYPYYRSGGISPTDNVKCQGYPPYCIACSGEDIASCRIWSPYNYAAMAYPRYVTDTREVVKYRTVTKYRDVTKYRQVPTKVLKERTVTQQVRMSIWEYLFR